MRNIEAPTDKLADFGLGNTATEIQKRREKAEKQ